MKVPAQDTVVAYSYLRFSSAAQAEGDSLRRQTALRDSWLKRHPDVLLDTSLTLIDAGVSGFKGKHRTNKKHALASFLDLVERGRVPVGSYLIVENLDRLTRETPVDAIPAVLSLIKAGICVVQLAPTEIVYHAEMDQGHLMMMLWELSRGHQESKRKSGLCGEAWVTKKKEARESHAPHGKKCPAWLELDGDTYRVKADAARAVKRIFEWCAQGAGANAILKKLKAEQVPAIGSCGVWDRSYVKKLLRSQTVLGIYQPCSGSRGAKRKPDGDPVPDYYPAIISEALWHAAQRAIDNRTRRSGRPTTVQPNPFAGLLRCALSDSQLHVQGAPGHKYLVSAKTLQKQDVWRAFPLTPFTSAVLGELVELKAAELFADPGAARLVELQTQLADVDRRLAAAIARFEADPESQQWQALVSKYDREKRAVVKELADERQRCANPLSAVWVEAVELMQRDEPGRLRAALLSVIECVSCLFVVSGKQKVAVAQVWFKGGGHREYAIYYRPQRGPYANGKPEELYVRTGFELGINGDLRNRDEALQLEKSLLRAIE